MFLPDYLSVSFPLPPPGPDEGPVCFSFDRKWIPYILGALQALRTEGLYTSDKSNAIGAANTLLGLFTEAGLCPTAPDMAASEVDDCMGCCIRMRNGILQVLQCGEWVTVDGWDKGAVAPAQPGTGSPQPAPGGCQSFSGIITPTGAWLLPVPVNSGDVVTIKNLQGAWSPSAFTDIWDCPDGNLYFAGGCIGGTSGLDSGAPMPTAPLNGTVLFDGTNYYDVSAAAQVDNPVAITIAGGIVNKQLIVRCNFHGGVDPAGEVTFDIEVCNNIPAEWTHTFDFRLGQYGWTARSAVGVWTAGVGWQGIDIGGANNDLRLDFNAAADFIVDTFDLLYSITNAAANQPDVLLENAALATLWEQNDGTTSGENRTGIHMVRAPATGSVRRFEVSMGGPLPGSTNTVTQITITGHGPDPF